MRRCEEIIGNRYVYRGEEFEEISEEYYVRGRYYNGVIGRFREEDV